MTAPTEAEEREAREAAKSFYATSITPLREQKEYAYELGYLAALAKNAAREALWRKAVRQLLKALEIQLPRIGAGGKLRAQAEELRAALGITGEGEKS